MLRTMFAVLTIALLATGCSNSESAPAPSADSAPAPQPATATNTAPANTENVYNVGCACTLGQSCGNMIEVDGDYIPLENEKLGEMEFCGQTGVKAKVQGQVKDGKFVADSVEVLPKE